VTDQAMELAELRAKLNRLSEQIVGRLKDRAWFALNPAVYTPGAIPITGRPDLSFMEWALEGLERYHASLGRFDVPDQHPLLPEVVGPSPVQRRFTLPRLPAIAPPPRDQLIRYYISILPRLCRPGDDPHYYGETAYADADLLARINERIYLGAFVAHSKLARRPEIAALAAQPDALRAALRDPQREADVIAQARAAAERYGLDAGLIDEVFAWIIAQTLDLEVRFVQQVAASQAQPLAS
jgi:chorismate mutase